VFGKSFWPNNLTLGCRTLVYGHIGHSRRVTETDLIVQKTRRPSGPNKRPSPQGAS
jgi:hypothetical protein